MNNRVITQETIMAQVNVAPQILFTIFEAIVNLLDSGSLDSDQKEPKIETLLIKYFNEVKMRDSDETNFLTTKVSESIDTRQLNKTQVQTVPTTTIVDHHIVQSKHKTSKLPIDRESRILTDEALFLEELVYEDQKALSQ